MVQKIQGRWSVRRSRKAAPAAVLAQAYSVDPHLGLPIDRAEVEQSGVGAGGRPGGRHGEGASVPHAADAMHILGL
jgi:hypothetical protein